MKDITRIRKYNEWPYANKLEIIKEMDYIVEMLSKWITNRNNAEKDRKATQHNNQHKSINSQILKYPQIKSKSTVKRTMLIMSELFQN